MEESVGDAPVHRLSEEGILLSWPTIQLSLGGHELAPNLSHEKSVRVSRVAMYIEAMQHRVDLLAKHLAVTLGQRMSLDTPSGVARPERLDLHVGVVRFERGHTTVTARAGAGMPTALIGRRRR